jgi:hypothetical protein
MSVAAVVGPLLPDAYVVTWVFALIVPIVLAALGLLLLYFVIKRAVVAGIREARAADRAATPVRPD